MSERRVGDRVGAVSHANELEAFVYGFGVYAGDEIPLTAAGWMGEALRQAGVPNPKLILDNGDVVWGCECWWGSEESVRRRLGDRTIVTVSIDEAREKVRAVDAETYLKKED